MIALKIKTYSRNATFNVPNYIFVLYVYFKALGFVRVLINTYTRNSLQYNILYFTTLHSTYLYKITMA